MHYRSKKAIEVDILTDKLWDELLESFEVMKYGADENEQRKKLEIDIHSSSNIYGKGRIESALLLGQRTAWISSFLWAFILSIRNPQY